MDREALARPAPSPRPSRTSAPAEYWENETRDLEEHVERLLHGGPEVPETLRPAAAAQEGPELTNKDFFWDL